MGRVILVSRVFERWLGELESRDRTHTGHACVILKALPGQILNSARQ